MRVQHNIMAMNSYRNYSNNVKSLSGNLEKLSSGYRINRAGDDAAGLAISEKMRSQITGLDAAQKNVKDGISLVKTAEGAMQEVQDMLKRMKYLATQSANGTYQDDVDREALQDEVNQLRDEINRIADSANFNGIKLLDGSLSGGSSVSSSGGKAVAPTVDGFKLAKQSGSKEDATITFAALSLGAGNVSVNVAVNGKTYTYNYNVRPTSGMTALEMVNADGDVVGSAGGAVTYNKATGFAQVKTSLTIKATDLAKDVAARLEKDLGGSFEVITSTDGAIKLKAKENGAGTLGAVTGSVNALKKDGVTQAGGALTTAVTKGKDDYWKAADSVFKKCSTASDIANKTYTINGVKFAFMTDMTEMAKIAKADPSIHIIQTAPASNMHKLAAEIKVATGLDVRSDAGGKNLQFYATKGASSSSSGGGLTLQIGDTADSFNQLVVSVNDMHTSALGVAGIDIGTREGAAAAIENIKDATNYVSSTRGVLGAYQNRLEHTANNLSTMAENIQDAESTIRDTDVADEMMSYVKNNILVQSAQAMLAQANQVPQGVLQLLG